MPEKKTQLDLKKGHKTPGTEVSQNDDKSTSRYVFYMIAAMAVTVIVGAVVIYNLGRDYVLQTNKNKGQDKTIQLLEQKKKDLEELKPNYEAITQPGDKGKSDADLILNAMPADEGYKQLIAMIEKMGNESGVNIPSISKSTTTEASQARGSAAATPYQISISMEGTFAEVIEFIKKTEKSSRVMNFVSLSFNGPTSGGSIQSSATFTVYWQKPADIAPTQKELE